MIDLKKLKERSTIHLKAHPESMLVRGNAIASGDAVFDKEVEDGILKRLNENDVWAWCTVEVWAEYRGVTGDSEFLGGCTYEDEEDFKTPNGYYDDMVAGALENLASKLEETVHLTYHVRSDVPRKCLRDAIGLVVEMALEGALDENDIAPGDEELQAELKRQNEALAIVQAFVSLDESLPPLLRKGRELDALVEEPQCCMNNDTGCSDESCSCPCTACEAVRQDALLKSRGLPPGKEMPTKKQRDEMIERERREDARSGKEIDLDEYTQGILGKLKDKEEER